MDSDSALRAQLIKLLQSSDAHVGFEKAVKGVPAAKMGIRPEGSAHSLWEELEHIRLAQRDILEFSLSAKYKHRKWPEDYWPRTPKPPRATSWTASVKAIAKDRAAFIKLLRNSKRNLYAPIAWGDGQTLLREALLIADHNAYHIGEIVLLRRLLGIWK